MNRVKQFVHRLRNERGITGLETAIVLIAFVVVAAVFAFVVLSTGLFSSERGKEAVYAGLAKTRGSMSLTGGIIADSNGTSITDLRFGLTLAAGGDSVNLDSTDASNRTVISYVDETVFTNTMDYTATEVLGDGDLLLEQGELVQIDIDMAAECGCTITENFSFTLELKPPTGSYLVIQRLTPASLAESIIDLN
ncbi:MAG: archaellin/type IV pilin N-terminal domain-containing protein [Dehalococcoidia bacterium]